MLKPTKSNFQVANFSLTKPINQHNSLCGQTFVQQMRFDVKNKNLLISYLCPKTCRDHNAHHFSIFLHEKLTRVSLARSTVLLIPFVLLTTVLCSRCSQSPSQVSTCKLSWFRKYSNNHVLWSKYLYSVYFDIENVQPYCKYCSGHKICAEDRNTVRVG